MIIIWLCLESNFLCILLDGCFAVDYLQIKREKEQLQHDFSKVNMAKTKLESLCRELQKQNKIIKVAVCQKFLTMQNMGPKLKLQGGGKGAHQAESF